MPSPTISVPDGAQLRSNLITELTPYVSDLMAAEKLFSYRPPLEGLSPAITFEHAGSDVAVQSPKGDSTTMRVALSLWVLRVGENTEQEAETLHSQLERRIRQFHLDKGRGVAGKWINFRFESATEVIEFETQQGSVYLLEEWLLRVRMV